MFHTHTTREGRQMPVNEMTDQHLLNYLKLVAKDLAHLRRIIYGTHTPDPLYDTKGSTASPEKAARLFREMMESLYPYLAEALIRPSMREYVGNLFARLVGRDGARIGVLTEGEEWLDLLESANEEFPVSGSIAFGSH